MCHCAPHSPRLTPAELRVAELLLCGQPDSAIAGALHCTTITIKHHIGSMFRKFKLEHSEIYAPRVKLVLIIHEWRNILGVRCQACE